MDPVRAMDTHRDVFLYQEWRKKKTWYTENANVLTIQKDSTVKNARISITIYLGNQRSVNKQTRVDLATVTIIHLPVTLTKQCTKDLVGFLAVYAMIVNITRVVKIVNSANHFIIMMLLKISRILKLVNVSYLNILLKVNSIRFYSEMIIE